MTKHSEVLEKLFPQKKNIPNVKSDGRYLSLGLKFNPFPRSGTANINSSDILNQKLTPIDDSVVKQVVDFINHSLVENRVDSKDKFISATITGDYGAGKTQLLMFIKTLLGEVSTIQEWNRNPYVIYIDNPGMKLSAFIGSIISKIGEESFRKYIWNKIIERISGDENLKRQLEPFLHNSAGLFLDNADPYSMENTVSYKSFLNSFLQHLTTLKKRKDFEDTFKEVILKVLQIEAGSTILGEYFYELISSDFGVNKTWEALSTGNIKQLENKEADIIRYIVRLVKDQGYTDFFILVDEFEDITRGRLTKAQADTYLYNLRSLLDEHREWCLVFAMNGEALESLRSLSPPLADRISTRLITLQSLNNQQAEKIVITYLNMARDIESDDLSPFDVSGISKLYDIVEGNQRNFLKNCYLLIEKAADVPKGSKAIDSKFVTNAIFKKNKKNESMD